MKILVIILLIFVSLAAVAFGYLGVEIPGSIWKGVVQVSFRGRIVDRLTEKSIEKFSASIAGVGMVSDKQIIRTKNGIYNMFFVASAFNGRRYIRNFRSYDVLGPGSEDITLSLSLPGYTLNSITLSKNRVLVGEDNLLDIVLDPVLP